MIKQTQLMIHQKYAVEKLLPSRIGAAFMDMGTGKTRTGIELIYLRQNRISNVVWFCPVSLKETIGAEILKHTDTACADICIFDHKINIRNFTKCFWYIVGIESMSASDRIKMTANALINTSSFVIVDESSYIKGHRAARTCWITDISQRARYRLILTGTPISQGIVDLFAQMRFLSPKILGYNSFYSFAHNHLEYSEKYPGKIVRSHNTEYIAAKIKPYVYQVTKEECLDLPEKLYESRYFSMTREQKELYEYAKWKFLDIDIDDWRSYTIFRLFSALQQIVSGYWNDKDAGKLREVRHRRVETLMDTIGYIPPEKKIIIWAKFEYDLEQIKDALNEPCALFYGKIKEKDRAKQVDFFREEARFFLATQSCGGHGLTLNEASYTIFYNNGFKYSERDQAEGRCHRIGQTSKVTYIDISCRDSIDTRIDNALYMKSGLVVEFKKEVDKIKNQKGNIRNKKLKQLIEGL